MADSTLGRLSVPEFEAKLKEIGAPLEVNLAVLHVMVYFWDIDPACKHFAAEKAAVKAVLEQFSGAEVAWKARKSLH